MCSQIFLKIQMKQTFQFWIFITWISDSGPENLYSCRETRIFSAVLSSSQRSFLYHLGHCSMRNWNFRDKGKAEGRDPERPGIQSQCGQGSLSLYAVFLHSCNVKFRIVSYIDQPLASLNLCSICNIEMRTEDPCLLLVGGWIWSWKMEVICKL